MDSNSKSIAFLAVVPLIVMVATFAVVLNEEDIDSNGMIILVLAAAFFILSAVMFTGLGAKIAGSFIHESEEDARYDSRIVATGTGIILLGAGIMAAISLLGQTFLYVGVLILIVLIFVGVIYIAEYSKGE